MKWDKNMCWLCKIFERISTKKSLMDINIPRTFLSLLKLYRGRAREADIKRKSWQITISKACQHVWNQWMIVALGHDSALLRLYWAGENLDEWDEFCYESCPWRRIDHSTCWPAVQRATTVPWMPPYLWNQYSVVNKTTCHYIPTVVSNRCNTQVIKNQINKNNLMQVTTAPITFKTSAVFSTMNWQSVDNKVDLVHKVLVKHIM